MRVSESRRVPFLTRGLVLLIILIACAVELLAIPRIEIARIGTS